MKKDKKKIIVIGCGFGGLQFIKHIKKNRFDKIGRAHV